MINNLLKKWTCSHKWKVHHQSQQFESSTDERPYEVRHTLICKNCGKIVQIKL